MEPSTSPEGTDEVESLLTLLRLPLELWPPEETDESGFKCSAIVVEEEEKSNVGIKVEWQRCQRFLFFYSYFTRLIWQ